ncbi:MAG: fructose-bisphosphate aldolase class I [Xanthomonadales bacterium]|jgi:fructose-bisphosphate aldolase class I|nr:fructose-bisphosphate aldolase class I [Xanthomonadales bacterium]
MNDKDLVDVAEAMVAEGKGILAIDESAGTCKKRFDAVGVECTEENRRAYRDMLLTTPGLADHISGAILFDETIRQATADGTPFVDYMAKAGIIPGIKVDAGAHPLAGHPGEKVTEGLDGLRGRLDEYRRLGARFAKWRAVITIAEDTPSVACLNANAHALARYAALCQEAGIVPIVEPEVLMDGDHSLEDCFDVTEAMLHALFNQLYEHNLLLEGTILKASMVISGSKASDRAGVDEVAEATLQCLLNTVPAALGGIVFLSGGQSDTEATAHLDAMNRMGGLPWPLSFSYGRALQAPALATWGENPAGNVAAAQRKLAHRARMNGLAAMGRYDPALEKG